MTEKQILEEMHARLIRSEQENYDRMKKDSHLFKGESFTHIASDCRFHQADNRCWCRKSGQVESEWR